MRLFFTEPPADCRDWRTAQTCEKGHGRLEWRDLGASTELNEFLAKPWSGVAQVFSLHRRVCKPLVCTQESVYGFTSLTPAQAGPERLLELIRDHWAIENCLHRRRDVTLGEDARSGFARAVLPASCPFSTVSCSRYLIGQQCGESDAWRLGSSHPGTASLSSLC